MYHSILRDNGQHHIKQVGHADLVIGLPSYKNASQAAQVAQMALTGAKQHYPHLRTVLVNADAGFDAATRQAVAAQGCPNDQANIVVCGRYTGTLGWGNAIAAILDAALALDAQAIVILDSNSRTITTNWLPGLADLILKDKADLVLPRYQWLLPEGALSDLIIYPLFRALWGYSVRHPAAPDFALSPQLATAVLDEDIWTTEASAGGFPVWLTTYGILGEWRVAQSALGEKRGSFNRFSYQTDSLKPVTALDSLSPVNRPASQLQLQPPQARKITERRFNRKLSQSQPLFHSTISVLLSLIRHYRHHWLEVEKIQSLSTLTQFASAGSSLPSPEIDPTFMLDNLALGWMEYRPLWQKILTPNHLTQLETLASLPTHRFYFPVDLWTRIIYDFAVVFNKGEADPWQIIQALFPIYQGRLAAYWQEIAGLSSIGCEGTVAAQAVEFEELRPYLKLRWRTYQPWEDKS